MDRYTKGTNSKVMAIAIMGGTVGTGKFGLRYGADEIASGLQSQTASNAFTTIVDYQSIVDGRWCVPESQISCIVEEAPGATVKFIVWLLQGMK